jgi:hypothetical protein
MSSTDEPNEPMFDDPPLYHMSPAEVSRNDCCSRRRPAGKRKPAAAADLGPRQPEICASSSADGFGWASVSTRALAAGLQAPDARVGRIGRPSSPWPACPALPFPSIRAKPAPLRVTRHVALSGRRRSQGKTSAGSEPTPEASQYVYRLVLLPNVRRRHRPEHTVAATAHIDSPSGIVGLILGIIAP